MKMFDPTKISDTTAMLDKLKDQGFYYSTIAGITSFCLWYSGSTK